MIKWFKAKLESAVRLGMCYALSSYLPLYIVNEYPKSGGTWVCQMLSDYLDLPFPRNQFPKFQSSIIHGHYLYIPRLNNVYIVMRDGRDVMVSFYYQSLFKHERFNDRLVEITRRDLNFNDYHDIRNNMPKFIEYKFSNKKYPKFTWSDFVNSWIDKKVPIITYESLLKDPIKVLGKAITKVCNVNPDENRLREISEKYSFKKQTGRNPGDENKLSFLRKGIAGDWKNIFSKKASRVFNKFAGNELIKLGYEIDDSWIDSD